MSIKTLKKIGINLAASFAVLVLVGSSLGLSSSFLTEKASAAGCQSPSIMFGRWKWCGYFYNKFQDSGPGVRNAGMPASVDSAQEFISLVEGDLFSGDAQRNTEASFIILTMIGNGLPNPPFAVGTPKSVSWGQITDFENRVKGYANISENGSRSSGSNGSIDWWVNQHTGCGEFNSYYQPTYQDIAPYVDSLTNSNCGDANYKSDFVIFRDTSGNQIYMLRRACFNPMGVLSSLSNQPSENYTLSPTINAQVSSSGAPITGNVAEPGDSVTFTYAVNNSGPTAANSVGCTIYANSHAGYYTPGSPAAKGSTASVNGSTGCPRGWPVGNTTLVTETVNNLPPNSTICRSLYVDHAILNGAEAGVESCIVVASKPYARAYGGDISAGNGFTTSGTCVNNLLGSVVGWNKEAAGSYAGAGAQFATLALGTIYDSATAQGNAVATNGSNLAFGNTSPSGGNFGGSFGSLSCIPDFYGQKPATTVPFGGGTLSPLTSNAYSATGPITISGNINPGQKTSLFVQGDVIINDNIIYPGSWGSGNVPLFELVVKGNIYVGANVTRLDGMYVAQPTAGNKGIIYTCSNGATPVATTSLAGSCNNKLTVNGAFIANSVQLLRASGSLAQSSAAETGSSGSAAEVFNYNPIMWTVSPVGGSNGSDYDSVTSLPPIL
ncbi:MAG TPA: hypothetical protein VMR45_02155 [Patescibacteria group bacterium]|nr:hypothetical protein [Patescibacteria group bacterium]